MCAAPRPRGRNRSARNGFWRRLCVGSVVQDLGCSLHDPPDQRGRLNCFLRLEVGWEDLDENAQITRLRMPRYAREKKRKCGSPISRGDVYDRCGCRGLRRADSRPRPRRRRSHEGQALGGPSSLPRAAAQARVQAPSAPPDARPRRYMAPFIKLATQGARGRPCRLSRWALKGCADSPKNIDLNPADFPAPAPRESMEPFLHLFHSVLSPYCTVLHRRASGALRLPSDDSQMQQS